jgi:hypothetical protein
MSTHVNHEMEMNFDQIGNGNKHGHDEQTVAVEMVSDACIIISPSLDIKVGIGWVITHAAWCSFSSFDSFTFVLCHSTCFSGTYWHPIHSSSSWCFS